MGETELFNRLKDNLVPDLKHNNEYDTIDASSDEYGMKFELKCRDKHYDTVLIEKSKYDDLVASGRHRYVVSTPQGIWSFNFNELPEPKWRSQRMIASTNFFRNVDFVNKIVGYVDISSGKNISEYLEFQP